MTTMDARLAALEEQRDPTKKVVRHPRASSRRPDPAGRARAATASIDRSLVSPYQRDVDPPHPQIGCTVHDR